MDTGLLALVVGAIQSLVAVLLYMGWDRTFMANNKMAVWLRQRVRLIPILALGGFLFSAVGFYRAFTHSCEPPPYDPATLIQVKNKHFENEKVTLDNYAYVDCVFTHVTFVYNGGPLHFEHNLIQGFFKISTDNRAVAGTVALMKGMNQLKEDVGVIGSGLEGIEPAREIPEATPAASTTPSPMPSPTPSRGVKL
jgi:hypothetical protein